MNASSLQRLRADTPQVRPSIVALPHALSSNAISNRIHASNGAPIRAPKRN